VGHGTHVSGIVARLAPDSKILPVRVLNVDGRGNVFILAYAIDWAVMQGADVINLSLGADADSEVLSDAVARAQEQGAVIVASAGNDNAETKKYPAAFPGVLSITAVDAANRKAVFANYGEDWVDLAAPGVGITSTIPVTGSLLYATWSGTSMATPFAAGAAALVREHAPNDTPAQIAKTLVDSGADLDPYNPQYIGKLGRLLDLGAALPPEVQITDRIYMPTLSR
jgi:subtilisin family serine protease